MVVAEVVIVTGQRNDCDVKAYDVVVIGGGAAGLSGALTLARARRSVLVIDSGEPRNAPASSLHGYLSSDGMAPGELLAAGRSEVTGYGGEVVQDTAISVARRAGRFRIIRQDGDPVTARRLLVTTGLVDELPDVDGLAGRWGRDVVHCPYCHGWEIKDQAIGVLATGPMAVHQAQLFRQWSSDVTLLLHTEPPLADADSEQLPARGIPVISGTVQRLEIADDRLAGVRMADGRVIPVAALVVGSRMTARGGILAELGLRPTEIQFGGHVVGSQIASDPTGKTDVDGVWVAGNVADIMAQLIGSAAAGVQAAAAINGDLIAEEIAGALAEHRDPFSPRSEAEVSARVLGPRRHGMVPT